MGKRAERSGVSPLGKDRIQFDFEYEGRRYRPTIERAPSEGNLNRAIKQLEGIKERIVRGTFSFTEEFPKYRFMKDVAKAVTRGPRLCDQVFDNFIQHCESRLAKKDLAFVTVYGYRNSLDTVWRPRIGKKDFESIRYSDLSKIADDFVWAKKTYNNAISVIRCAFEYGYRDLPEKSNPAERLKAMRITNKDREPVDPFPIAEAEILIAAIHRDWGEAQGDFDEFRFFTGLRPSEEIALEVGDCDLLTGKVKINKARVMGRDKDRTKTSVDRTLELCPRALQVLKRQMALRERLKAAGLIHHEKMFFKENGEEIVNLQFGYERWKSTLTKTVKGKYREPYCARHSWASWILMIGKNLLWASKQNGHSVQVMLAVYAAWMEGAGEAEIAAIKAAMVGAPASLVAQLDHTRVSAVVLPFAPLKSPGAGSRLAVEGAYDSRARRKRLNDRRILARTVRAFDPYALSRGAPSTTRPPLRIRPKRPFAERRMIPARSGLGKTRGI
jgi:integrase